MLGFIETKPPARMQVMLYVFLVLVQAQGSVASPLRDVRSTKTSVSGHVRMVTGKMRRSRVVKSVSIWFVQRDSIERHVLEVLQDYVLRAQMLLLTLANTWSPFCRWILQLGCRAKQQ